VDEILRGFGLEKASGSDAQSSWRIPTHRFDLQRDVDLIEEVVRGFGIQNVPGTDRSRFTPESEADRNYDSESFLRDHLVARGLTEVRTSKLISRNATRLEEAVELRNPLNEDHVALRASFFPPLLDVVWRNVLAGAQRVAIFELGRVFLPGGVAEERDLGIALWGNTAPAPHWRSDNRALDYFDLKGVIDAVIGTTTFKRTERPGLIMGVEIWFGDERIGFGGQVSSEQFSAIGAAQPVFFAELKIDFVSRPATRPTYREIDRFPAIVRDIAMIVPQDLGHEKIRETILGANEPLLVGVELFDVFSGSESQSFGAGKKSMAYALTYRDKTRTLTNDEITGVHAKIRERLQRELGVELRE
jgi:phenylalanyl-tRNA synthetase beta chain